jgi:phosphate transport system substrate-binding protein
MHKVQADPAKGAEVVKFFDWAFKNGQKTAEELDYVPLPSVLVKQIDTALRASLKDAAGNPVVK